MLKLSDFDYHLPKELIAQYPLKKRDTCRLMVVDREKKRIGHCLFKDISGYFRPKDLLVLNDTKVLACRLKGFRPSGGKAELLLIGHKSKTTFSALISPARIKIGDEIIFNAGKVSAKVTDRNEVAFDLEDAAAVYKLGVMPLPPYIKREAESSDAVYYQTVYAKEEGAIASPTAGLHFTRGLLDEIRATGVNLGYITLHVGYGTFKPVKSEDIARHKMEPEYFRVPVATERRIKSARAQGARIFAVGTTACRALEAYAAGTCRGDTDLFIYPGYKFKAVDCLITNFHLPRTTLFMLACAFGGEGLVKKAYQEAVAENYRFYSYGDAMLII